MLPISLKPKSECKSFSLSLWCKPILGSARIYKTPVSALPICVASLMRWLSPPDKVDALRDKVRYPKPTLRKKLSLLSISLIMLSAIICSVAVKKEKSAKAETSSTAISQTSAIFLPPTVTANASFFSLFPLHIGQSEVRIYLSISHFTPSELV